MIEVSTWAWWGTHRGGKMPRKEGTPEEEKEEDKAMSRKFHSAVLSGNLRQDIYWATDREGGGCLLKEDLCTKPGRPVAEVLRGNHPDTEVPPCGKYHACSLQRVQ